MQPLWIWGMPRHLGVLGLLRLSSEFLLASQTAGSQS